MKGKRTVQVLQPEAKVRLAHELATEIAHRIRNPLGSIELFASLLLKDCPRDREQRRIEQILGAVKTINRSIAEFMAAKRSGQVFLCELDIHELLREIVGYSETIADNSEVFLKIKYAEVDPIVAGNRDMLKHLLVNLILHALHSLPKGCHLTIETQVLPFGGGEEMAQRRTPCELLSVIFRGADWVRTEAGDHASLFEAFMTSNQKSVGLGLAILHSIMDLHDGYFAFKSEEDGAISLTIFFPVQFRKELYQAACQGGKQGGE